MKATQEKLLQRKKKKKNGHKANKKNIASFSALKPSRKKKSHFPCCLENIIWRKMEGVEGW